MVDEKIRKCCPNCSQFYNLKLTAQQSKSVKSNLPLFLACGHSMCENCISNIVKFTEPIECKICHLDMILDTAQVKQLENDKVKFRQMFPINVHMVGELTLQHLENTETKPSQEEKEFFIDLLAIMKEGGSSKSLCMECHNPTTKMCQQCVTNLCEICFNKSHKNFVIFKNHVLKEIDEMIAPSTCKTHSGKPLDYYCKSCEKSICMDCLMVGGDKSCKNHDVVSMQEINDSFLEELNTITPKVDETFRRLTKTAYDVGHLLHNMESESGAASELTQTIANIEQHFSKLCSIVQKHKQDVIDMVTKLQNKEKDSLYEAKEVLTNAIKKAKKVVDSIEMTSDPMKIKQMNLAILLEDAKQVVASPWYLSRDEELDNPLNVSVKEDLCALVSEYVVLEGSAPGGYSLRAPADLAEDVALPPPPAALVYAPVLPRDVRQAKGKSKRREEGASAPTFHREAPQYRTRSGSACSQHSRHSAGSDSSHRAYPHTEEFSRPVVQPVQPFPESQPPKQLHEGAQELIYISHIVTPHDFYVQRACHQALVKDMLRQLRAAASLPKPSANHVAEGKTYLAFNKADNMWQRCRVVSIERREGARPLYHVFCYDFGSTEKVDIDKLRVFPSARLQAQFPLAINCSLANCEPRAGAGAGAGGWASDDSFLVQSIIDNKQAVLHVRRIRSTANYSVTLECDVTTLEDGVSLAHALVFHERATMPDPRLKYPSIPGIREKAKIFSSNYDYKYKCEEEVTITHVCSPDKFYVRKKHQQSVYEQLCLELEQEYSAAVTAGTVYLPEIGMSCCVLVPQPVAGGAGAGAARAQVTALPGRGRAALVLVDSGAPLLAHWSALRYLHHKFARLNALATECHLAGVTPLNRRWSPGAGALLQQYRGSWLLLRAEEGRGRGSLGVTLHHRDTEAGEGAGEDLVCINQLMIKHKFAITFGIYSFNKHDDTLDQVITNKSPLDEPVRHPKPKPEKQILKRTSQNDPPKVKAADLEAKDKGPLRLEAKVLQYQSPSLVYISLAHQQKTFNELFENMQKYYSKNKPAKKSSWQAGERCAALCRHSQTWRRAVVLEVEGEDAKLFYSDFASVETLPAASLQELPPEFSSIGDAAIECHLCGVVPAVGEEWPSLTKEYLKELLDCYPRIFITKVGNFKNKSMPVEIWAYHTIQGSALEPNRSEWRCLNKKIVEQGLGVPDNSEKAASTETKPEADDNMVSFLNVTGSIHDWLQLEPVPTKPLPKMYSESPNTSNTSVEPEDLVEGSELKSNVLFISDWLPAEPLQCKEFTGMPTYIDNDGVIYLHDVSQRDTLDLIRKALDVRFRNPDPKAKYQRWVVGEPCVALYFLDDRFYRGRVLDVNTETSTCVIHYIDYGNEERCAFENMRKSIALHQIPTQAHKCVLDRIRPSATHWDRQTLDYIHKSVVEKECHIRVSGETVDDVTPIELKYDKLWINDHLVEFELASYTDGTKAVVRKFAPTKREEAAVRSVSDSDPDYIVESDGLSAGASSVVMAKDWNEMLEEDEKPLEDVYMSYPNDLNDEFECNITVIHDPNTLELDIIHDDNTALVYEEMFKDLQVDGENRPALNGVFENKACIALFQQDQQWYRASILQYSKAKEKVKVRYVDYGNIEVVDLIDVREIHPDWVKLPPSTVTVELHGVKLNPEADINVVTQEFADTFLEKGPFAVKVIRKGNAYPVVELRSDSGELVYQNLIEKQIFLKNESD